MTRKLVLSLSLALALGTAGCKDQRTELMAPSGETGSQATALGGVRLERGRIKLPSSDRLTDQYFADAARRAIDPDDYECNPSTPVIDWFFAEIDRIPAATLDRLFFEFGAPDVPFLEALFFLTDDTPQVFGYNGEYTRIMQKTHRDAKRFWNIPSDDIQLLAMKGSMLLNINRVAATYEAFFVEADGSPVTHANALIYAAQLRTLILQSPTLNGGNHPLFSFNAFALSAPEFGLPDKIVMGDGILAGYAAVGFQDVAPQAVYAHEFGHHIQFENGYFEDPVPGATTQAELTRYTELMADAFSAYYLTHKRGAGMKKQRVEQFLQVFFQIGDCAFDNPGHHGTPNQRMAAARFGFSVADEAQKKGHILTSQQFHARFVAAYPQLVAPDA